MKRQVITFQYLQTVERMHSQLNPHLLDSTLAIATLLFYQIHQNMHILQSNSNFYHFQIAHFNSTPPCWPKCVETMKIFANYSLMPKAISKWMNTFYFYYLDLGWVFYQKREPKSSF